MFPSYRSQLGLLISLFFFTPPPPFPPTKQQWIDALAQEIEHAQKVGYLYKRGANNPAWKRRWFVLRGTELTYFDSQVRRFFVLEEERARERNKIKVNAKSRNEEEEEAEEEEEKEEK